MKNLVSLFLISTASMHLAAQDSSRIKWSITPGIELNTVPIIDFSKADSAGSSLSFDPYIKVQSKDGLGIKAQAYLLSSGNPSGYYMTAISPFYSIEKKKINFDLSYTHFFMNGNESMPYTPLTNEIYASLTRRTSIISPFGGIDVGFGTDTTNGGQASASDINIFLGATHSFGWDLSDDISLDFSPKVLLNIGTDNYFGFLNSTGFITHAKNLKKVIKTKVHGNGNRRNGSSASSTSGSVTVNNLEADTDFNLSVGNFSIEPAASLLIPFGADNPGVTGYWQLGISYKFSK